MKSVRAFSAFLINYKSRRGNLCSFDGLQATGANVIVYYLAFLIYVRNFLNVGFESSSRSSLGMAYIVTGSLTLSAYAAYSRHNILPP